MDAIEQEMLLFPVRCTCGRVLSDKQVFYESLLKEGKSKRDALNILGVVGVDIKKDIRMKYEVLRAANPDANPYDIVQHMKETTLMDKSVPIIARYDELVFNGISPIDAVVQLMEFKVIMINTNPIKTGVVTNLSGEEVEYTLTTQSGQVVDYNTYTAMHEHFKAYLEDSNRAIAEQKMITAEQNMRMAERNMNVILRSNAVEYDRARREYERSVLEYNRAKHHAEKGDMTPSKREILIELLTHANPSDESIRQIIHIPPNNVGIKKDCCRGMILGTVPIKIGTNAPRGILSKGQESIVDTLESEGRGRKLVRTFVRGELVRAEIVDRTANVEQYSPAEQAMMVDPMSMASNTGSTSASVNINAARDDILNVGLGTSTGLHSGGFVQARSHGSHGSNVRSNVGLSGNLGTYSGTPGQVSDVTTRMQGMSVSGLSTSTARQASVPLGGNASHVRHVSSISINPVTPVTSTASQVSSVNPVSAVSAVSPMVGVSRTSVASQQGTGLGLGALPLGSVSGSPDSRTVLQSLSGTRTGRFSASSLGR